MMFQVISVFIEHQNRNHWIGSLYSITPSCIISDASFALKTSVFFCLIHHAFLQSTCSKFGSAKFKSSEKLCDRKFCVFAKWPAESSPIFPKNPCYISIKGSHLIPYISREGIQPTPKFSHSKYPKIIQHMIFEQDKILQAAACFVHNQNVKMTCPTSHY